MPRPYSEDLRERVIAASELYGAVFREIVETQNDATLQEYADRYEHQPGRHYSISKIVPPAKS